MSTQRAFPRVTIRASLFTSFALILSVWLTAGYYFTSRFAELEARGQIIGSRYTRAQDLLTTARQQILLSAVYTRDALLATEPSRIATYRREAESSYAAASLALQDYVPVLEPSDGARMARLQKEIVAFRNLMLDVLAADRRRTTAEAGAILRSQVMPRRQAAVRIVEELSALNRQEFMRHQAETAALYKGMQRHVWMVLGLALLAGIGIAVMATLHAGHLERDLRIERAKDARNTRDLQRLSARLTTVQEEERRTIARELHDEVGQLLTALKMELAAAERALAAKTSSSDILQDARLIADGALHTVRDLSRMLHPSVLDDLGLSTAVDCYLKGFGRRHGLEVALLHEGMRARLPSAVESAAYRIVQEALTNVAKHARASSCLVRLEQRPGEVVIAVEDNGVGFDWMDGADACAGLGLIGIRERALQVGGTMSIDSAPGHGTKLTVHVPLPFEEQPEDVVALSAAIA